MSLDKRSVRTETNGDVVVKLVDTAGTNVAAVSAANALKVDGSAVTQPVSGTVTTTNAANQVDDAAFTPATSTVTMVGFEFDDVTPDSVNEGDGGAARMSANRNVYMTLRDAAGNERGANVSALNELAVLDTNSAAQTTALQLIDDAVYTDGSGTPSKGIAVMGTDGTNPQIIATNATGHVLVDLQDASVAVTATDLDIRDLTKATDSIQVSANTTANSSTNPIFVNVTESTGTAGKATFVETAALAAQASATLSGAVLTASKTGTFNKATISSEVPFKAVLQKFDEAAVATTFATIYGEAGATHVFEPANPSSALFQVASDASPTAKFQIVVTNNNSSGIGSSGIIHATIEHDEI